MLSGIYKLVSLHSLLSGSKQLSLFFCNEKGSATTHGVGFLVGTFLVLNQCLNSGKKNVDGTYHVLESNQKPINITSFDDYNGIFGVEG